MNICFQVGVIAYSLLAIIAGGIETEARENDLRLTCLWGCLTILLAVFVNDFIVENAGGWR